MEEHRLKPMSDDFNHKLFNELYSSTDRLRKSLAYGINPDYFKVDKDIILGWFDTKLLLIFQNHFDKLDPDRLKGQIISGLKNYQKRLLKASKQLNNQVNLNRTNVGDTNELAHLFADREEDSPLKGREEIILSYMRSRLSSKAYNVFICSLYPPEYILKQINDIDKKIPNNLIEDYFGLSPQEIRHYKNEIYRVKQKAQIDLYDLVHKEGYSI